MKDFLQGLSLTGRRWTIRPTPEVTDELARAQGLSPLAARCLAHRTTPDAAAAFLATGGSSPSGRFGRA